MSFFSQDPTRHDFFVSLAGIRLSSMFPSVSARAIDGATPFDDFVTDSSPVLFGYRPDGIFDVENRTIILEVKSYLDIFTSHTREQMRILRDILLGCPGFTLYLLIFDCPEGFSSTAFMPDGFPDKRVLMEFLNS